MKIYDSKGILKVAAGGAVADGGDIIAAGTQTAFTTGTVIFSNSNGISFGMSNSSVVTASYTVPSVPPETPFGLSAGTQSVSTGTLVFSNSNNVSFGMSGSSRITASASETPFGISAGTQSVSTGTMVFSDSNGISFGMSGSSRITASYTVPTETPFGVSAGTQSVSTGTLVFSNSNNVSFGMSGSSRVTASASFPAETPFAISAGTQSVSTGTMVFSDSNGISFGMSGSSRITASYTVPTQTNQTLGLYASSNTTGQSSSSTFDARTISFRGAGIISVGMSAGEYIISASAAGAADGVNIIAAGTQTANTTGTVVFSNSNNVTFGMTNSSIITASISVPPETPFAISAGTQSVSTGTMVFSNSNNVSFGMSGSSRITASASETPFGISAGTQSVSTGTMVFSDSNGISFGMSGSSRITASYTVPNATQFAISAGTQSVSTGTMIFSNSNNISFGMSGSSRITASVSETPFGISAGTQSVSTGTMVFSDSNGISFGMSGSSRITATYTVPVSVSAYAFSNTTQSSTGTMALSSLQFAGAGGVSVGITGGSVVISGGAGGGGAFTGGMSNIGNTAGTSGTVQSQMLIVGGPNITISQSINGQSATLSVSANAPGAAAENNWVNLLGANTAGNTTASGSTLGFSGLNLTLSGTNASQVVFSAPATSSLSATGVVQISTNVSTISIGVPRSYIQLFEKMPLYNMSGMSQDAGTLFLQPFTPQDDLTLCRINLIHLVTTQGTTTQSISGSISGAVATSGTGMYTRFGTMLLLSRVSAGTNVNSSNIVTFFSNTFDITIGMSCSVSQSTNVSSATVSVTTSGIITFISSIDTNGGQTTGSSGSSGSTSFSSTSTNGATFSSSFAMTFGSQVMSRWRPVIMGMGTSLNASNDYWLGIIQQSSTASTNYSLQRLVNFGVQSYVGQPLFSGNNAWAQLGYNGALGGANSNWLPGLGSIASSVSTTTFASSNISAIFSQTYFIMQNTPNI